MRRSLSAALTTFLTAGLLLTGAGGAPAESAAPPSAAASEFTPIGPVRALDTRNGTGTGGATSPVGAGQVVTLDLLDFLPASATAVTLNVTAVTPTAPTYVTVFPAGTPVPTASNLNLAPGDVRANQVTVVLGAGRKTSLYNNSGNVHLVADIAGYYGSNPGAGFTPLPPERALDTRTAGGPLGPGTSRVVDLANRIPASATAVTFNLTATDATATTFVTAWATGEPRPNVSNLNVVAGDTRPNLVTVPVTDRKVSLYNNAGSVHLLVDVTGFYTPDYGAAFVPVNPTRVLDTRDGTGTGGTTTPVGPGTSIHTNFAGELPASSVGVLLNVTGVNATASTYVTATAPVGDLPNASTLNISPGQTVANAASVAFATPGEVAFYNNAGTVHLVADLAGAFTVVDPTPCTTDCVYAWGRPFLGTAAGVSGSSLPGRVVGLSGVRAVAGGNGNGYALRADGTVLSWGDNSFGQLGNGWVGGSYYTGSAVPVPVVGLTGVTAVAAGTSYAYAVRSDGTVWAWGQNFHGQLGNGSTAHGSVPVRVSGLTDVVAVAASSLSPNGYALRADGTVWAWGIGYGALGDGTDNAGSTVPVRVSGLTGVTAVSGGSEGGYALRGDGTVWAWGRNGVGELGNGQPCVPNQPCVALTPVQVSGLTDVTAIAGAWENGYALRADGTVWSWGANSYGQLGTGEDCGPNYCVARTPVRVPDLTGVTGLASRDYGAYALRADGSVWSWGTNWDGALGTGAVPDAYSVTPVQVQGLPAASAISGGASTGYAIVPRV